MSPARFSVNQIVLVNLLFVVLMAAGLLVARKLPLDVYPDIAFDMAIVVTIWPGASPDEVERLLTRKIEEEIADVAGIKEWHSFSANGASEINVQWDETLSEIEQQGALNALRAAIDRVRDLPDDAEESFILELSVSEVFSICFATVSDVGGVGEFTLREVARDIEHDLDRIPGVRDADPRGIRDREIRVYVDKIRAHQANLTLPEIASVVSNNNQDVPGGTFSNAASEEVRIRGLGSFLSPEALAATVVGKDPDGRHILLGDVAEVVSDFERRTGYSRYDGNPAVSIAISKDPKADVSRVVASVREVLDSWRERLPPGVELDVVSDGSLYVGKRIEILRSNLALGVVSVVFILWLTVGFRNSMLAIVGVPFSFLTAVILFPVLGITINSLSLVGFVMVSGMLVDDAIIVLENIYRHIEEGKPVLAAVVDGTEEVMWPVVAAVATTMAAFVPMLLVSGSSGEFMSILPKTVIVCLAASIVEALLILPAHYLDWGSQRSAADSGSLTRHSLVGMSARVRLRVDQGLRVLRHGYLEWQTHVLRHRYAFLACCAAAFYFSCGLSQHIPVDLFPSDFNDLYVMVQTPIDFGIEETNEAVLGLERALDPVRHELSEVTTVVGEGITADEAPIFGPNYGLFFIAFPNTRANVADPDRILTLVRDALVTHADRNPAIYESVNVASFRSGPPIGKPVAIRIRSDSYDLAKRISAEMKRELSTIPGVYNIEDNVPLGPRELSVGLNEHRASIHGLAFSDIGMSLRAANEGLVSSHFKDPNSDEDVDIRVLLAKHQRRSAADFMDVEVRTPEGYRVKLGDVANVSLARGYQRLYHWGGERTVVVYADVDNIQASSVSVNEAMQQRFADVPLQYPGVSLAFGGEFEDTREVFADMGRAFFIALIAIYSILAAQFRSYAQPLVVMCVIALAYIGVVIGMWIGQYAMSMYVIYALIGLAGIVVNDSLVFIDFVNRERIRGAAAYDAVRLASRHRFRAILLTTLTTIAGLLPMAFGLGGRSPVFGPFATTICAGLAVASVLTLFVVPSLYLSLEDLNEWRRSRWGRGLVGTPIEDLG